MNLPNEVAIFSCGRIGSQRCKNKMLRPFGETTLVDIALSKMSCIKGNTFFAGHEEIFRNKCKEYGVDFIHRSSQSTNSEVASEIYSFLKEVDFKYLLCINACQPFLKVETIENFLEKCLEKRKPSFAVFKKNNYFMDIDNNPYNFDRDIKTINTKFVSPVKEFAHVFYFYEREYFLQNGVYWNWDDLNYIEIPSGIETLDIDTEEDFEMANLLWQSDNIRKKYIDY